MENAIILVIVLVVAGIAAVSTWNHFRGKGGGCCGGGGYRPRRKKLDHVVAEKTFLVEGMTCEHCKNRVEEAVNLFGSFDENIRLIESEFHVAVTNREGEHLERRFIGLKFVTDERICDGQYYASAMKLLRRLLNDPSLLLEPPAKIVIDDGVPKSKRIPENCPPEA